MSSSGPNSRALIALPHTRTPSPPHVPRSRSTLSTISFETGQVENWQPILHASNQIVLYNPHSHALSISPAPNNFAPAVVAMRQRRAAIIGTESGLSHSCPYCKQSLPADFHPPMSESALADDEDLEGRWEDITDHSMEEEGDYESLSTDPAYHSRASDYFRLLAIANETSSAASSSRRASLSPSHRVGGGDQDRWSRRSQSREGSRVRTPMDDNRSTRAAFPAEKMAEGYFKTFFQEEYKLGMGANGSVFLCQHVLDGNSLGHFAVKKIAVGESHSYLIKTLREVRLLERLHHPNIITYHHAWLETSQFSSFGPKVPTLHVLMQWAEGGSLDDFIDVRLGRKPAHIHMHPLMADTPLDDTYDISIPASPASSSQADLPADRDEVEMGSRTTPTQTYATPASGGNEKPADPSMGNAHAHSKPEDPQSRSARIRAFRAYQRAPPEEKERMRIEMETMLGSPGGAGTPGVGDASTAREEWTAVHLLSAEEVKSLFRDVVEGLGFLHSKSILHLDLKPGNVLLTWDEGRLIPRAMLSDFGTSRDMINSSRTQRSGNTGTLEYTAPESLPSPHTGLLQEVGSKADMWSLGMILHKLLFFKLPYRYAAEGDANGEPISRNEEGEKMERLEKEVFSYPGFKSTPILVSGFEGRRLPRAFLVLLENLLHTSPAGRPSCERVVSAIREGKLDPLDGSTNTSLPLARHRQHEGSTPTSGGNSSPGTTNAQAGQTPVEKSQLLALPSPLEVNGSIEGTRSISVLGGRKTRGMSKKQRMREWGELGMKVLRSSLLVGKIATIPRLCAHSSMRARPAVVALLLALAVADTVVDHRDFAADEPGKQTVGAQHCDRRRSRISKLGGVWFSVGLALLHFGVVGMSARGDEGTVLGNMWNVACCESVDRV